MKTTCMAIMATMAMAAGAAYAQDNNYSESVLMRGEVATPSGTGNETGGFFFARSAQHGQSVMAAIYDPSSPNESCPSCREYYASTPATPTAAQAAPATIADNR